MPYESLSLKMKAPSSKLDISECLMSMDQHYQSTLCGDTPSLKAPKYGKQAPNRAQIEHRQRLLCTVTRHLQNVQMLHSDHTLNLAARLDRILH